MKRPSKRIFGGSSPIDEPEAGQDDWLLSYSDLMTLLFAFFTLLLALSTLDPVKMQIVAKAMNEALGGVSTEPRITLAQIQADLERIIRDEGLLSQVNVNRDKHGVALSVKGSTFFSSGSAELLSEAEPFLTMIASLVGRTPYKIAVEGHTDNVPIHTALFPSNWELSSARASTVVRFFLEQGLDAGRFRAVGYADTQPVDTNQGNLTEEARARNRRVVILFLDEVK